jgi:predicted Zn-dependent protease
MLPFSRNHETEADKIGLTLMAIAGYNPDESITFIGQNGSPISRTSATKFMSTHPSDATESLT